MAQVYFTVDADMQLRRTVGLRARVRRAVTDVLEAALEIGRLGTWNVSKDAPLIVRAKANTTLSVRGGRAPFIANCFTCRTPFTSRRTSTRLQTCGHAFSSSLSRSQRRWRPSRRRAHSGLRRTRAASPS